MNKTLITEEATDGQKKQVERFAEDAVIRAFSKKIFNREDLQKLIEDGDEFQADIIASIGKHSQINRFADEEVESYCGYPLDYKPKSIEDQVDILRHFFRKIGHADEKIAKQSPSGHAEAFFAIPRWQLIAETYDGAVYTVFHKIKQTRKCHPYNEYKGFVETERTARKLKMLSEQQEGCDILIVAAQFGMRYRGCSVRRARELFTGNEFGLGAFEIGCMILTHPERFNANDNLWIDCAGNNSVSCIGSLGDMIKISSCMPVNTTSSDNGSASAFLPRKIS
ncbi:MAG: hypothetical protein WA091_03005 [Minisyncoccales bacterium]